MDNWKKEQVIILDNQYKVSRFLYLSMRYQSRFYTSQNKDEPEGRQYFIFRNINLFNYDFIITPVSAGQTLDQESGKIELYNDRGNIIIETEIISNTAGRLISLKIPHQVKMTNTRDVERISPPDDFSEMIFLKNKSQISYSNMKMPAEIIDFSTHGIGLRLQEDSGLISSIGDQVHLQMESAGKVFHDILGRIVAKNFVPGHKMSKSFSKYGIKFDRRLSREFLEKNMPGL